MPVTPAEIDAAVPPAGTPDRTLTNAALKGLITDIAAVGVGIGVGTVNTFADLPAPATVTGERWWVLTSTGVWLVNRKTKGAYYSDGVTWSYLGDFPVTAAEVGNVPAGGIAAVDVQAAINELDTDKADKTAVDPLPLANAPATPPSGTISVGRSTIATFPFLSFQGTSGLTRLIQPFIGTIPMVGVSGFQGNSLVSLGGPATTVGSPITRNVTSTDAATRTPRIGLPTTAAAGNVIGVRSVSQNLFVGNATYGGFFHMGVIIPVTEAAGQRTFSGISGSVAAPTNVNPAALTNVIGIATIDGSNNWHIVFGGSVAQTPIDLGANFPSRVGTFDKIQYAFYWPPGDNTTLYYEVIRNDGAFTASGTITNTTPGTTLPATTTPLSGLFLYRTNNATAATTSIDISVLLTLIF